MEKKYRYYVTKKEKVSFILAFLLITASVIWAISQNKNYLLLVFIGPVATCLFYPFTFILTADNMLDTRSLFGSKFKPFSVNQITHVTQKSKNEAVLVYNRDGLRGDRILHLSETDMKDFLDELTKRNPAIEVSYK